MNTDLRTLAADRGLLADDSIIVLLNAPMLAIAVRLIGAILINASYGATVAVLAATESKRPCRHEV